MTTTKRRGWAVCLALMLCLMLPVMAAAAQDGTVQGSTISGTVRVYLSSIGQNASGGQRQTIFPCHNMPEH